MYKLDVRKSRRHFDSYYLSDIDKVRKLIEIIEKDFNLKFKGMMKGKDINYLTCFNGDIEIIITRCYVDLYSVDQINKKIQELE